MLKSSEIIEVLTFEEANGSRRDGGFLLLGISLCKIITDKKGKKKVMSIETLKSGELIICYRQTKKKNIRKKGKNAKR